MHKEKEPVIVDGNITLQDFEIIFKSYYNSMCAYANQFLKDVDASEEVVQEVMFRIWVNRSKVVINTSISGYLFRAVRNSCMNVLKHIKIHDQYQLYHQYVSNSDGQSHEDHLIISELEQKIREAIDRLPPERKKVFILSRYDGLSYIQIAEKLNLSVKTVENQMGKALKTLREDLSDYLPYVVLVLGKFLMC